MKTKKSKKKQKGIAERKTEVKRKHDIPYKAIGMGLLLWVVVTWLFFGHGIVSTPTLSEGQKAPSTIVASVAFECENLKETDLNRITAAEAIAPVFTINPVPAELAVQKMEALFDRLMRYAGASTNELKTIESSMDDLLMGSAINTSDLIASFPSNVVAQSRGVVIRGIKDVMRKGILSDEYRVTLFRDDPDRRLSIVAGDETPPLTVSQKDIYSTRKAVWAITEHIADPGKRKLLDVLLPLYVVDNMTYDKSGTEELRQAAADAVEPVIQQYAVGTTLVQAGEPATPQTLLLLQQHELQRKNEQEILEMSFEILGSSLLLLAGLIAAAVILRIVNPALIRQPEKILLMVILSLFTLGTARLLTYLSVQYALISPSLLSYLVPHALAVLLAGILLGGGAAICVGFWCSFATAVLFEQSFSVFVLGMLITITATSNVRNIHRRASLFRAGICVCGVKVVHVLIIAVLNPPGTPVLVGQITAGILSGMLATILTLLLIPVFEKLFKITTDITLLELSDMGHPLLQKMAIQAPGTYHHSLMVATLAQNAAEAVGANSLLVRVCAYYHDIGKMAKPEFFTENIQHKENPHDELSPHMSALVISSHVKEGLTLAKRHKLPQPVLDAIEQHHGNGLISYFYHKAKTMQGDGETTMADVINDSDFRYGGAPAVTPEMAILSLADASEAASRSIEKPTLQKITNMMDDIFAMKIRDGQMDHANLTMAQINVVKQSFIFSLSNMLHGRIPYPKDNEPKSSQSASKSSATPAEAAKAD
ncbi:MAG: HDIG domain-containing protein [Pontiella sp.]|nr:HDIG domain-containing protein [Pontiella sp.]MBT8045817.1 HDIG domain-containing protein [Pontiella sp.]